MEVTTAANLKPLIDRIKERKTRWFLPIRRRLEEVGVLDERWKEPRFLGFVREANLATAKAAFSSSDHPDVAFCAIEEATFLWRYWDKRMRDGLPR